MKGSRWRLVSCHIPLCPSTVPIPHQLFRQTAEANVPVLNPSKVSAISPPCGNPNLMCELQHVNCKEIPGYVSRASEIYLAGFLRLGTFGQPAIEAGLAARRRYQRSSPSYWTSPVSSTFTVVQFAPQRKRCNSPSPPTSRTDRTSRCRRWRDTTQCRS